MIKKIYLASSNDEFNYPICYETKEDALKMGGVKRIVSVAIAVPDVDFESVEGMEEDVTEQDV